MAATATPKRTASRAERRQQLIDATMKCIARKGMSSMTLGDVARGAGLSQGIVNLHFMSKDNLLKETLQYLADEYRAQFEDAVARAGPDAGAKLLALLEVDLRPSICHPDKIAVWFAFWGEVKSRPTYRRICDESDRYYDRVAEDLCREIIADGGYDGVSVESVTTALTSMTNGMWLSCLINPRTFDRRVAMRAIEDYLRIVFPKHYR
ncbi:MAG TPA: TetR family transcriptional regulator C-terminal domain-containing protein [Woeseiaceae bacterium]